MLLTEVTVAFILETDVVISLLFILFDKINGILLFVNGIYIKVIKSLLNGIHLIFPTITINSHFEDKS